MTLSAIHPTGRDGHWCHPPGGPSGPGFSRSSKTLAMTRPRIPASFAGHPVAGMPQAAKRAGRTLLGHENGSRAGAAAIDSVAHYVPSRSPCRPFSLHVVSGFRKSMPRRMDNPFRESNNTNPALHSGSRKGFRRSLVVLDCRRSGPCRRFPNRRSGLSLADFVNLQKRTRTSPS